MPVDQNRSAKLFSLANKAFIIANSILTIALGILSLVAIPNLCACLLFLIYSVLYGFQACQHYLIYKFATIDINKHHVAFRRTVITICMVDMGYMLMAITFWQKSEDHPVYCVLCLQYGLGRWVGIFLALHCIFLIGWAITLIQAYVNRRYFLLAIGGFEAEQRILEERERQLHQMMIIEPDVSSYPIPKSMDKYYKFEDVHETEEENYTCSICLNKHLDDDHFVNAGCGHFYHQVCLIQWAHVNSNCPQCRFQLVELTQVNRLEQNSSHDNGEQFDQQGQTSPDFNKIEFNDKKQHDPHSNEPIQTINQGRKEQSMTFKENGEARKNQINQKNSKQMGETRESELDQ